MATAADAELVLKLYDLRRESTMRTARAWMMYEFEPETWQDIHTTVGGFGSEEDQFWRQVLGYWEMAASLVLRGALDADLFLDSNTEGFYFLAKFERFRDDYQKAVGMPFMPNTMELVEKYPAARTRFDGLRQHIANRRAGRQG